jgi:hypothetical protein
MRTVLSAIMLCLFSSIAWAEKPLLLVTPNGVWKSEVTAAGPGPWIAQNIDVIVQGFGPGGPDKPDTPDQPPVPDDETTQIVAISKSILKDKAEATACAALVSSLVKSGLTGDKLKQAMELAAPILDAQLKSGDRITRWAKDVTAITLDAKKLSQALVLAWGVDLSAVEAISASVYRPEGQAIEAEALDFAVLIQVIMMIIELLKSLGVI